MTLPDPSVLSLSKDRSSSLHFGLKAGQGFDKFSPNGFSVAPLLPPGGDHVLDCHELLTWRTVAGAGDFGGIDLLPIAEGHNIDPATLEQRVKRRAAGVAA